MILPRRSLLALAPLLVACAGEGDADRDDLPGGVNAVCRIMETPVPIDARIDESSGVAIAAGAPDLFWTHNDSGGEPELYAVRSDGALVAAVRVGGASNRDWEDLAAGPCPQGRCLYIGEIGDNEARRGEVAVYRVREPAAIDAETPPAERFTFTYPGGPRDAEALFVLPDGGLYVISKGRTSNIAVYRYPQPLREGAAVVLEHVVDLTRGPADLGDQVTAADASPDGRRVAVRSYSQLMIFRTAELLAGAPPLSVIDLAALGQSQGEAVAIGNDGRIVLTGEAKEDADAGTIVKMRCSIDQPAAEP